MDEFALFITMFVAMPGAIVSCVVASWLLWFKASEYQNALLDERRVNLTLLGSGIVLLFPIWFSLVAIGIWFASQLLFASYAEILATYLTLAAASAVSAYLLRLMFPRSGLFWTSLGCGMTFALIAIPLVAARFDAITALAAALATPVWIAVHAAIGRAILPELDRPDLCIDCGYSLVGLEWRIGLKCPECGREIKLIVRRSQGEVTPRPQVGE